MPLFKSPIYRPVTSDSGEESSTTPMLTHVIEVGASQPDYSLIYVGARLNADPSLSVYDRVYWSNDVGTIVFTSNARWDEDLGRWYPDRDAVDASLVMLNGGPATAQQLFNASVVKSPTPTWWSDSTWDDDFQVGFGFLNFGVGHQATYLKIYSQYGDTNLGSANNPNGPNRLFPDGMVKAWVYAELDGTGGNWVTSSIDSYNVSSVTRVSGTRARVNFHEDFVSEVVSCAGTGVMSGNEYVVCPPASWVAGYMDIDFWSLNASALLNIDSDPGVHHFTLIVLGRQL